MVKTFETYQNKFASEIGKIIVTNIVFRLRQNGLIDIIWLSLRLCNKVFRR